MTDKIGPVTYIEIDIKGQHAPLWASKDDHRSMETTNMTNNEDKRSEEQKVVSAIRELEELLGWEHQYPLIRQDVHYNLLPAAEEISRNDHEEEYRAADLLRIIGPGVDTCLFEDGIASRYARDRPCERVIPVSRSQYRAALPPEPFPARCPCMLIPDNSDRIRYVSVQYGDSYPDAEIVPLFRVKEGETPQYLSDWGMEFRWVD